MLASRLVRTRLSQFQTAVLRIILQNDASNKLIIHTRITEMIRNNNVDYYINLPSRLLYLSVFNTGNKCYFLICTTGYLVNTLFTTERRWSLSIPIGSGCHGSVLIHVVARYFTENKLIGAPTQSIRMQEKHVK
jgi:hypothetical protein